MKLKKEIFYVIPALIFLILDELFIPYAYNQRLSDYGLGDKSVFYREILGQISKFMPFLALLYVLVKIWKLRVKNIFLCALPVVYFAYMVFESLYLYGSFFQFPHVGLKIMDLVIVVSLFMFYQDHKVPHSLLMHVIIAALLMKIAVDPSVISSKAFVDHDRGIPSASAFLLLLPCLYFFNVYIVEFRQSALIKFGLLLGMIVFFQHRTVWVATFLGLIINIILLKKQNKLKLEKAMAGIVPIGFIAIFAVAILLTYLPQMVEKIDKNIEDITNPTSEGTTSGWRIEQYKSYMPFVLEHPIEGMRFKGFELPIQFYHPGSNNVRWAPGTGHHFHSFYFDKLFYFGLLGVVLYLIFILRPITITFREKLAIDHRQLSFVSFVFSGFVYGLSYDFPTHYWIMLGIALAIVERELTQKKEEDTLIYGQQN